MNQLCLCGPRGHAVPPLLVEDAGGRADPTGTARLASQFQADMDRRWRAVRVAMVGAVQKFAVPHPAHGGDPVRAFQSWLDETMRQVVLGGTGIWMLKYLRQSEAMAVARGQKLASSSAQPRSRLQSLLTMAGSELQGIMDATSQQATRAFAAGLLVGNPANSTARTVAATADTVGKARGRLLTQFFIVRVFSAATLDAFRAAGVRRVGTKAETKARRVTIDKRRSLDAKPAPKGKKLSELFEQEEKVQSLGEVDVLTAGDDDVCPICEDISDGGPYDIDTAESLIPAHPRCRCAFVPTDDDRFAEVGDAFDPDEPRDVAGKWTSGGSNSDYVGSNDRPTEGYKAVSWYQTSGYNAINGALRKSSPMSNKMRNTVNAMDRLIKVNKTKTALTAWRGIDFNKRLNLDLFKKNIGSTISLKGFTSVSMSKSIADDFGGVRFKIDVPKGTNALEIKSEEKELILPRDTKFKVIGVKGGGRDDARLVAINESMAKAKADMKKYGVTSKYGVVYKAKPGKEKEYTAANKAWEKYYDQQTKIEADEQVEIHLQVVKSR